MTLKEYLVAQLTKFAAKVMSWANAKFATKSELPDLSKYFNAAPIYNSESKKIEFYHDSTKVAELDATAFIKDGMVNTVSITDGKTDGANNGKKVLLITFNTDSGKEDIEIPLDGIFDASNYMTKGEVTAELAKKLDTSVAAETYVPVADFVDITDAELNKMFEEA